MTDPAPRIRELLIDSCHASHAAEDYFRSRFDDIELLQLLVTIAADTEDYGGDAPMQAAYWTSQYPAELLVPHEPALLEMLPIVNGYGGHIAFALGKTGTVRGREAILRELGDGRRFDAWLFHKGLEAADQAG